MPEIIEYRITAEMELLQTNTDKSPSPQSKATPEQTQKKIAKEASNEASGSVSKLVAIQMGKQALQYGMSNYGNSTGDYVTQAILVPVRRLEAKAGCGCCCISWHSSIKVMVLI